MSEEDLISGTDILLEGSKGKAGLVIMVNLEELTPSDQEFQGGYVEFHKCNKDTGKRARVGQRQVTIPCSSVTLLLPITNICSATVSITPRPCKAMH